jgi:hypothetical protein
MVKLRGPLVCPPSNHGVDPVTRYSIEYTEAVPPEEGADQERLRPVEVTDDAVRPEACPGVDVAEPPALIEAYIVVPFEYVTHLMVPLWNGDSPVPPFDVRMS